MKEYGNATPGINGCLVQGSARKRNLYALVGDIREYEAAWHDVGLSGQSGEVFAGSRACEDDETVLREFTDVIFGLAYVHRRQQLGTGDNVGRGGFSFRSLLLAAFLPHGGVDSTGEKFHDRRVVYVDVDGSDASDKLTIQRKLALIQSILRPGEVGQPCFVVVAGDQPTFKVLFDLWRDSRDEERGGLANDGQQFPSICGAVAANSNFNTENVALHKWLVPFPGFFHVEKQALYPIAKELLDGLGLQELAAHCGLPSANVANVLQPRS
jgi:hypothetical protein